MKDKSKTSTPSGRSTTTAFELRLLDRYCPGKVWRLEGESGRFTLGRSDSNTIQLESPCVSRHHCTFHLDGAKLTVEDVSQTSGIFVNYDLIRSPTRLHHGDVLRAGDAELSISEVGRNERPTKSIRRKLYEKKRVGTPNSPLGSSMFALHVMLIVSWLILACFVAARYLQVSDWGYRYQARIILEDDAIGMQKLLTRMYEEGWQIDFRSEVVDEHDEQRKIVMIFKHKNN